MKSKLFLIISFLIVGLTSCMTLTEYEKVVNAGYKQTKTYENYAASNDLDLLEKKDKIYFNNLSDDEKKDIFPEYPEQPNAVKKFLYGFIKIDFEQEPVYYKLENDIFKKDDYIFFFIKEDKYMDKRSYMYISIKNKSKNWFHMGAVDFKSGNKLVRINFEAKKLASDTFWLDRTRSKSTEEYIAFILEDSQVNDLVDLLNSGNTVDVVLYSDYSDIKRTRELTTKEREDMLKVYNFYEHDMEDTNSD
ncbi:MAG: hypothetical protein KBF12_01950 [Sebaldella sp.]|nr:hypothetical protein [Sebaldella sp.]